ncbi:MAG: hypothetical protein O7C61_10660 [SAR324 cluster bacterium]|nr:hypothetical protein [SAR324 cluster bacterium]
MFNRFSKESKTGTAGEGASQGREAVTGQNFAAILQKGIILQKERAELLREGLTKGLEFFEEFNESRLNLAFTSFDEDMKIALYEVLFLLHVNDPSFAELKYTATEVIHLAGSEKDNPYETTADLYVENAPHGVEGLDKLSPIFKDAFHSHIRETFNMEVPVGSAYGFCPIVSIHSLGSIGTVGHKSRASDLDLQVQFELEPFLHDTSQWNNQTFLDALTGELKYWVNRFRMQQQMPPEALKDPKVAQPLRAKANQQIAKRYPKLSKYLLAKSGDFQADMQGEGGQGLRGQVLHELILLMKRSAQLTRGSELKKREILLKERINRVQDYIAKKYPHAEIYLFSASNDNYRKGNHGTTLESKESSGSAYELILNYETLMPGIQITPMVPTHFALPKFINDDPAAYERIMDYVRFGVIDIYDDVKLRLVNLGPTPDLTIDYVGKHSGAVYWEAFKASSGNLPKALLNLLRYEMMLDKRISKTNIQILKDPKYLSQFISAKPEDPTPQIEAMVNDLTGIPIWALSELDEMYPRLLQDPWWLRYKSLKVGFHEEDGIPGLNSEERKLISKNIDLAFALHVRLSDVFTKPGDTRSFDTHREQVLLEFLKRAFPPISPKRKFLEHLFIGDVRSVVQFEKELRDLFKSALKRVNQKIADLKLQHESNMKEFEIWFHYYQQNFEPPPNVVQRSIMVHLTVPRGNLQVGYKLNEGWFFRSRQKESSVGKRFDTFGMLDHLPEEVMLREKSGFLAGLADAVVNGYYGIINQGTLKETRTVVEFDSKFMDLGNKTDNTLTFVRPDSLHRLLSHIIEFFPYQPYSYLDCINKKREVTEVVVMLNLLKFGRLSILSRDNLRTWYCDEYEHPDIFKRAHALHRNARAMITMKSLHMTLAKFLKTRNIRPAEIAFSAWVNPNSVETSHSAQQMPLKEKELSEMLMQIIMQVHSNEPAQSEELAAN